MTAMFDEVCGEMKASGWTTSNIIVFTAFPDVFLKKHSRGNLQ
jgi:hypothetical protein